MMALTKTETDLIQAAQAFAQIQIAPNAPTWPNDTYRDLFKRWAQKDCASAILCVGTSRFSDRRVR